MSTLTLLDIFDRPSILGPDPGAARDAEVPERAAVGGVPTLDEVLGGTWEAVMAGSPATCLICEGSLEPRYGAGHAPVGARCRQCGSELS